MAKIYRFLGRSGRTTIPYPMRLAMNLGRYDLISYEVDGDSIIVRKEKICDNCAAESGRSAFPGDSASQSQKKQNTKIGGARKTLKLKI